MIKKIYFKIIAWRAQRQEEKLLIEEYNEDHALNYKSKRKRGKNDN